MHDAKKKIFSNCIKLDNFTYKGTKAPSYDNPGKNVFSNCPRLDKISVPKNYEGKTFCGHKTTKGISAKEWFEENIGWWLSGVSLVVGITSGIVGMIIASIKCPGVINKNKDWWISHCSCCQNHDIDAVSDRDTMMAPLNVL